MKKRLQLIISLALAALAMFSCAGGEGGEVKNTAVFEEGRAPALIFASDVELENQQKLYQAIKTATGEIPYYDGDAAEVSEFEIVVGNTSRAISSKAYRKLRSVKKTGDYQVAYVIYASGGSVALAYEEDYQGVGAKFVLEHFIANYVSGKTSLKLDPGVVYSDVVSVLDYYGELDEARNEAKWQKLIELINEDAGGDAGGLGEELVKAAKQLFAMYDPDVVTWFANLYEPFNCICGECVNDGKTLACHGGGYYYSNSARDNAGYAPDTESTSQALNFLESSGITVGKSYADVIPESMKNQIIKFIRSCQDPKTGFFYNPQWAIDDTDAHVSRRARDLGWCTGILKNLGSKPIYDTPNGVEGERRVQSSAYVTDALGQSTATLVGRVVLSAGYDPNFENLDTLKQYLATKEKLAAEGKQGFYSIGNEITAQMPQIIARDKALNTWKTADSMAICVTDWFSKHQSPITGTWENEYNYAGVNALLKISGIYTSAEVAMPYAEEAARSAILAITSDEEMGAVVDLYNTWFSVKNVVQNLRTYGGTEGNRKADEIVNGLRAMAPDAIRKSGEKISAFAKPDGSFSYTKLYSSSTSQGMPVAMPNSYEGDVNATVISISGLYGNIFEALEINASRRGNLFGSREAIIYFDIISKLGPVQKIGESDVVVSEIDFEDEVVGDASSEVTESISSLGGYQTVVNVGGEHGKAVNFVSVSGAGDSLIVPNNYAKTGSCIVFDCDYLVKSEGTSNGYIMQISVGYSYMFSFDKTSSKVVVYESTTSSSTTAYYNDVISLPLDEWFNVRIEYYGGNSSTTRVKFYINDELIVVSDNFKGKSKTNDAVNPNNGNCTSVNMYAMSSVNVSILLDNIALYTSSDKYVPALDTDTKVVYDVERGGLINPGPTEPDLPPEQIKTHYDFEEDTVGETPKGVTSKLDGDGTVTVCGDDENKYVNFTSKQQLGNYFYVPNRGAATGACYVFESRMRVNSADTSTYYFAQINLGGAYMFALDVVGGRLRIFEATTASDNTAVTETVAYVDLDEWFDVRVEYYKGDANTVRIKFYVNGDLMLVSDHFYGLTQSGGGTPYTSSYARTQVYAMSSAKLSIDFDDCAAYVTDDAYTPATEEDTKIVYNVDAEK